MSNSLVLELASKGYWPAVAREYLEQKKYSRAVELCQLRLKENPDLLSGRIILARAFYHSGQYDQAEEQFYRILQVDPSNLVALKYLGDLKFRAADEATAFSYYERIWEIDPLTNGLCSFIEDGRVETTRLLVLKKEPEKSETIREHLRQIPFITETLGDLLLAQGHPRLAIEVFRDLTNRTEDPRLKEKLNKSQELLKHKDKQDA
jgi:tetratricopeptide (TPR) repeat protein